MRGVLRGVRLDAAWMVAVVNGWIACSERLPEIDLTAPKYAQRVRVIAGNDRYVGELEFGTNAYAKRTDLHWQQSSGRETFGSQPTGNLYRSRRNDDLPLRNPRPSHDRLAATYSMVHVMSEAHRYQVVQMFTEDGNKISYSPTGPWVVLESALISTETKLDAQRLRADTAEAELSECKRDRDTEQRAAIEANQKLNAAEQCNAELRELLRLMTNEYACCLEAGYDRITFLGGDCDSVSKMLSDNANYAKACAALNPNPEAESHES